MKRFLLLAVVAAGCSSAPGKAGPRATEGLLEVSVEVFGME